MIVLICTRKHTTIPYKAASKFLDQRKGREGNEERGGGGGGGGLFVEEMERGEGGNVVKWGNGEGVPCSWRKWRGGRGEGCEMGEMERGEGGKGGVLFRIGNGEGGRGGIL